MTDSILLGCFDGVPLIKFDSCLVYFENTSSALGGGLAVTGSYPGKARTPDELRSDFEQALSLIPGKHRLNLHAFYGEFAGKQVDRNQIETRHFRGWIDWAKQLGLGLDFNPTCFSHPHAADGFTLSHWDQGIRQFWIEHCQAAREIGAAMGKALGSPTITNVWIPDGYKDLPVDRLAPRQRLADALDQVFAKKLPAKYHRDAVECKRSMTTLSRHPCSMIRKLAERIFTQPRNRIVLDSSS